MKQKVVRYIAVNDLYDDSKHQLKDGWLIKLMVVYHDILIVTYEQPIPSTPRTIPNLGPM